MLENAMKTLRTAADVSALSEDEKNAIFAFDTARARVKGGLIRAFLIPIVLLVGMVMSRDIASGIDGIEGIQTFMEWISGASILLALAGPILFSRHLVGDYKTFQAAKNRLEAQQIDATALRSKDVWAGLFVDPRPN